MAVISTIKPDGTGDFTSLQAWEDWADGDPSGTSNAAYWAECYKGGNLGAVNFGSWSDVATTTYYPKIYVADGQGHGGDPTDGAYIQTGSAGVQATSGIEALWVSGLRIDINGSFSRNYKCIDMCTTSTKFMLSQTVENCYIHSTSDGFNAGIFAGWAVTESGTTPKNVVIRNNIVENEYGDGSYPGGVLKGVGIVIGAVAFGGSTAAVVNAWIHNNTVCSNSSSDDYATGIGWYYNTGKTLNLVLENNYSSMEDASANGRHAGAVIDGATLNITVRNNGQPGTGGITSFGLNDDVNYPGHATVINAAASDQFTDRANGDYSLKETSVLKDAGKVPAAYGLSYISVASEDVLGNSRPQYTAWDIGAHELLEPVGEAALTGSDVIHEIITAKDRKQGGICVNSGGITFSKRGNDIQIPAQNQTTELDAKYVKQNRQDHRDEIQTDQGNSAGWFGP
jgi:hypothetical protein